MNLNVLILYITLVCVSAGPSRSKALKHEDAEGLDKVEMREATEADDANNRLETPPLESGVSALEVEVPLMKKAINRLQIDLSSDSSDHPNPSGSSDKRFFHSRGKDKINKSKITPHEAAAEKTRLTRSKKSAIRLLQREDNERQDEGPIHEECYGWNGSCNRDSHCCKPLKCYLSKYWGLLLCQPKLL